MPQVIYSGQRYLERREIRDKKIESNYLKKVLVIYISVIIFAAPNEEAENIGEMGEWLKPAVC
jgi:hypothetical protein